MVASLAKLSVKEGGEEAARRLHRYLTAGENGTVPAYEITVVHGLVVRERFSLDGDAYLAPYRDARAEFDLPEEPEPLSKESIPDAAVLVRSLGYGPGVAPNGDGDGLPDVQVAYRFPADYRVNLWSWFDDSKLLVDLLAIVTQAPLLSRRFTSDSRSGSRRSIRTSPSELRPLAASSPTCGLDGGTSCPRAMQPPS